MTCLDDGLTLKGQPAEYWAGNYAKAHEGNPWFYHLLAKHRAVFIAWESASILVFTGMILLMPQTLALTISIAFSLGYLVGASTWLLYGGIRYGHEMFSGLCDCYCDGCRDSLGLAGRASVRCTRRRALAFRPSLGGDTGARCHCGLHESLAT